uniref:GH26 domain-containing protein n=1 Tax=Bionectria ochroleuca TaxID=29856 RepID=A0A8H7N338_BIOOC
MLQSKLITFLSLVTASLAAPVADTTITAEAKTLEAEDATLSGTEVLTELAGYSGSGYVGGFDESTDKITFTIDSDALTLYDVSIRYAGIYGEKRASLVLNGGSTSEVIIPETTTWDSVSAGQVLLNEGSNTIDIVSNWGWYLIDYIELSPSEPRPPHNINANLVNSNANADAKALYSYLISIYGKKILSGQQDLTWADWIEEKIGKIPALVSVDLMDYSPSRVEHGTVGTSIEEAITHAGRGGIISVLWHWNAPTGLYDTDENPWWSGFYTRATDFNVATALADTTNANYTLIIRDIDAIATELKRLQSAGIPVLFRPLHEAEGAWFWWGAQGAEPAKKLWALLYDRLTNYHELNNLIWVWNSVAEDWYPGDDTVDIVSADVYATGNGPMSTQYQQLVDLGKDTKLIAATEVGSAPLPDQLIAYEAHWLWFAVWGDTFINNEEYNSIATLTTIYNHDYVLTLDEIQGWRG